MIINPQIDQHVTLDPDTIHDVDADWIKRAARNNRVGKITMISSEFGTCRVQFAATRPHGLPAFDNFRNSQLILIGNMP
jgi:hypothetical protein